MDAALHSIPPLPLPRCWRCSRRVAGGRGLEPEGLLFPTMKFGSGGGGGSPRGGEPPFLLRLSAVLIHQA